MRVKLKTRKAASKRVKIKKNCLRRKKAYKGHLLRKKNSKQLRGLSEASKVHSSDVASFEKMLPYR
jgi:large subunit ribosomal protein L35